MKQLNVTVKNKNTLILAENGHEGDYINLSELANVDCSQIEDLILKAQDKVYQKKLNEYEQLMNTKKQAELNQQRDEFRLLMAEKEKELQVLKLNLEQQHQTEIAKLNETISNYDSAKSLEKEQLKNTYEAEIIKLKAKYQELENSLAKEVENSKLKMEQNYKDEISRLNTKIQVMEANFETKLNQKDTEMKEKINKVELDCATKLNEKDQIIKEKEFAVNQLQNQKSALNIKLIGENLETTCNNEMESYMQNGFLNCTWEKDNVVIKDEGEKAGSKADYIFKIYATEEHNENELLTSVCLDMKDENPDSKNKLKNSDHFATLDKNRKKKGCKYAVLVSTLEMKTNNDLPIRKVREYEDMYVVRPAYMVSFLSMITSLTMKFKNLILEDIKEKLEVKSKQELLDEFETIKNSYLDKQLLVLEKEVNSIRSKGEVITNAARAIDDSCEKIARSYIDVIHQKLETFEAKINKSYRKYEKTI